MYLRWEEDRPLGDRDLVAELYQVSPRTVRRHCTPVRYLPRVGRYGGLALYDVLVAGEVLETVAGRRGPTFTEVLDQLRRQRAW